MFVAFTSQTQVKNFFNYMNNQHLNVKFTFDVKQINTFSFSNTRIGLENNKITASVYRKPTLGGWFTNYASFIFFTI